MATCLFDEKITHSFLHLEFDPYKNDSTKEQVQRFYSTKKARLEDGAVLRMKC